MKRFSFFQLICTVFLVFIVSACGWRREDIGPYQGDQQTFGLANFDRLDMGSAFTITVQPGTDFRVVAEGDRRNLDDLDVYTRNGTLYARYRNSRNRQYETAFTITMPTIRGVAFSGASQSSIAGFDKLNELDIELSGASKGQFQVQADRVKLLLTGASNLQLGGVGRSLVAELSGASILQGFGYAVNEADLNLSGASKAHVSVSNSLDIDASGASYVRYRGNPSIHQRLSGASTVETD
ncbi:head GIN domain-containing protein [Spirosoma sp. SC4-14]|uniref:head GIN domain-containing protein n=1 Tax=Spirosoma sp. SC4-14 TaxID=3128900 RepID=UPI0030D02906